MKNFRRTKNRTTKKIGKRPSTPGTLGKQQGFGPMEDWWKTVNAKSLEGEQTRQAGCFSTKAATRIQIGMAARERAKSGPAVNRLQTK